MPNDLGATSFEPAVADDIEEALEHFNANHADTILLVAGHVAGTPLSDAEAVAADPLGVDFAIVAGGAGSVIRFDFDERAASYDDVQIQLFGALQAARAAAGDSVPLTSLERELAGRDSIPTLVTEVVSQRDLTPNLREVVIGGQGLQRFESVGGDQFVYVLVARPDGPAVPDSYSMEAWLAEDPDARPSGAYYTVRAWDARTGLMTLWVVLHDEPGEARSSSVGGWFARCAPGDRLAIWGPRQGFWSDGIYQPEPAGRHHLFVTDESGFCAVAALLEGLPPGDTATVVAETVDATHTIEFPASATDVRWHHRGDEPAGVGTGLYDLTVETLGELSRPPDTAFGAAESRQITKVRKYVRHTIGLPATSVSMTGYWRRDVAT